jgi:hypothetical protein
MSSRNTTPPGKSLLVYQASHAIPAGPANKQQEPHHLHEEEDIAKMLMFKTFCIQ